MLDTLRPTATGLDKLPVWFLRLAAPVLCGPVADLINTSLVMPAVPSHAMEASTHPAGAKNSDTAADFRPISITPVLSRTIERIVVRRYIYPALSSPPPMLQFADQFAFRPTGSTTAAITALLNAVINLYCHLNLTSSHHFSKAFDTVRHSSLLHKLAQLNIPDYTVYLQLAG